MARMPDAPSTITWRASAAVGPTKAIRRRPALTSARTHSAPQRVLPKPRPVISSHTRQDPAGGYPEAWDMLMFGMRLGGDPRVVVTTTPKPTKIIRDLLDDPTTIITRGTTYDNATI